MESTVSPPGQTQQVVAERVLVLAPHQDDELLGCGGLLRQLVAGGAKVRVLFLSDGGGGVEQGTATAKQEDYSETRNSEARAVAEFGGWTIQSLDLPDGGLVSHRDEIGAAISDLVCDFAPDLLLAPSPFERTPDHVAAFDALFEVLHSVRTDDALQSLLAPCRFFLYSVNHPGHPNLLVDVSDDLEWLQEGMELYPSQLALHNYTEAGIGLRTYLSHSLPTDVSAAEGYISLRLDDFTTNSRSTLLSQLDSTSSSTRIEQVDDGIKSSLIVRTFNRPEWLRQALESVATNYRLPSEVIVVNDGGTDPKDEGVFSDLSLNIVQINLEQNRGRAVAANAGVEVAEGSHLGFLDDDDLLFPEHFQVLHSVVGAAGVAAAYSDAAVATYELVGPKEVDGRDGGGWVCMQRGLPYSRDFDPSRLLVDNYIPFHTLLLETELALSTRFDPQLASFEDWDFLIRLSEDTPLHHVRQVTCEYRHFMGSGHHALGAQGDDSNEFLDAKAKVIAKHQSRLTASQLSRAVTSLRRESVELGQEIAELRSRWESDRLERAHAVSRSSDFESKWRMAEDRYHREHGEVESLRGEERRLLRHNQELEQEIVNLREEGRQLEGVAEEHAEHLGRTYEEIERLMEIIRAMEQTKAWRLHSYFQRKQS